MADIILAPHTHAFIYVWTDEAIERELSEEFSFVVPGAEYMKKFRRNWNGRIRLYNRITKLIYAGLAPKITAWAQKRGYSVENRLPSFCSDWTAVDTNRLLQTHPVPLSVRDYQVAAITHGLYHQRCVLISPTASGKSLILYYLVRARMSHGPSLLIVPTISLVAQMLGDWKDYGWANAEDVVHCITGGVTKQTDKPIVLSTWQSIYKQEAEWFSRYTTVLGDECVAPFTHVTMANGTTKFISEINTGEWVRTINEKTFQIENKPVLKVHKNLSRNEKKYRITLSSGKKIIITGNHQVMLSTGEWCRVDMLKLGDLINSL